MVKWNWPGPGLPIRGARGFLLLVPAFWTSGCFLLKPSGDWMEAGGSAVRESWGKTGEARLRARHEAVDQARRKIWDSLLVEKVDLRRETLLPPGAPGGESVRTIEYLVMTDPVFASKLRALVGSLQPVETVDGPGGEVDVRLRLDRYDVAWLVAGTAYAMREEERL